MSFLYPSFLWALAAAGIPIAIHLFNLQRPRKLYFPNVRFLRQIQEVTRSTRQLKHWLVLAARVLAIACLVMAFAQPVWNSQSGVENGRAASCLYVDNSWSMQGEGSGGSALNLAANAAERLVSAHPSGARFFVTGNDFDLKGALFTNGDKALDRIRELQLSNQYREAASVYRRQENALATLEGSAQKSLFWFSDFQKSTLGRLEELSLDTTLQVYLFPISVAGASNLYVDSIWLETPFVRPGATNKLLAKISNSGQQDRDNVLVKMFLGKVQVSSSQVKVPAGASVRTEFTFSLAPGQDLKGRLSLDDQPLSFDNTTWFVLNPAPAIRVSHIAQGNEPFLPSVYNNPQLFDFKSYPAGNVDYERVGNSELVVVEGLPSLSEGLLSSLRKVVEAGGSICLIPGADKVQDWNAALALGRLGYQALPPDSLRKGSEAQLENPDARNPFFEGVFEEVKKTVALPWANPQFGLSGGGSLLKTKAGKSVLTLGRSASGKVFVFTSALKPPYASLAQHSLFVPVMYRMAMLSQRNPQKLAYTFQDRAIELDLPQELAPDRVVKLVGEDQELIPAQRVVGKRLVLELPQGDLKPGYYSVKEGEAVLGTLALNIGHQESNLTSYTPEELKRIFAANPRVKVADVLDEAGQASTVYKSRFGTALWTYFLLAALLFLVLETLLLRFWK